MFGLSYLKLGALVALAVFAAWAFRVNGLRAHWHAKYDEKVVEAIVVRDVTREQTGNKGLKWSDVPEQIRLLGAAKRSWQDTAELQSSRIQSLGEESARLKQLGEVERAKALKAIAARDSALKKLDSLALSPGERSDLAGQLLAAEEALDIVFKEGL